MSIRRIALRTGYYRQFQRFAGSESVRVSLRSATGKSPWLMDVIWASCLVPAPDRRAAQYEAVWNCLVSHKWPVFLHDSPLTSLPVDGGKIRPLG